MSSRTDRTYVEERLAQIEHQRQERFVNRRRLRVESRRKAPLMRKRITYYSHAARR